MSRVIQGVRMASLLKIIEKNKELFKGIALSFLKEKRKQVLKEVQEVEKLGKFEEGHNCGTK